MRTLVCAAIALTGAAVRAEQPLTPIAATVAAVAISPGVTTPNDSGFTPVPAGTPVRLMFLKEITSHTAHPGDRFRMRVDEPVYIDGRPVIPVGTFAWGEVVSLEPNGAAGHAGKIAARLLYLELPQGHLPLRGQVANKGSGNGGGVLLAIAGFGPLGLLTQGDSARFKAGDMLTAYVDSTSAVK